MTTNGEIIDAALLKELESGNSRFHESTIRSCIESKEIPIAIITDKPLFDFLKRSGLFK